MDSRSIALRECADVLFNKRYVLKSANDAYTLPSNEQTFSSEAFEFGQLMKMREELNETKSLLNDKDIQKWRNHTKKTNPCGLVVKKMREQVNPELCTQAWAKFYEILSACDVVPAICIENKKINSLHLCEAPGAFIACLNHFIKSKVPGIEWRWLASTLNPFYEGNDTKRMIEGERFILETKENWNFGKWFDGDLMNWENLEDLQQQAMQCFGKADLVTADGSIDCASEPERQETMISQLLYCEVVAALTLLAKGGSFVLKMFTMFEHYTISILYLLCCCFTKVEIIKPGTSKAGNSEVYCVCTDFLGSNVLSNGILEKLREFYTCQQPGTSLFSKDALPATFLTSVEICAETFAGHQKEAILRNIEMFGHCTKAKKKFLCSLREYVASEYLSRLDMRVLDRSQSVVPRFHLTGGQLTCWPNDYSLCSGQLTGSYNTRIATVNRSWQDRVVAVKARFETEEELIQDLTHGEPVVWLSSPSVLSDRELESDHQSIRLGKKITRIQSSRFCPATRIDELDEAMRCATVLRTPSGRTWLKKIEEVAKSRLGNSTSTPRNLKESVFSQCHLMENPTRTHCIDISGDCRFAREVVDCGLFQPENCVALLCTPCAAKFRSSAPSLEKVVCTSTCSNCSTDESSRLQVLCGANAATSNVICGSAFAGCSSDAQCDELSSRAMFLNQCLVALRVIKNSEHLVLEISDTLTQFTAGLMYILNILFEEVAFCPVAGNLKCYPRQFLVCRSYIAANNIGLTDHLSNVARIMAEHRGQDVICLVPIRNLFSKEFYHYLRTHTIDFIKRQLDFIINLEKIWLNKSSTN